MKAAATAQKPRREYHKDGDSRRKRQQKERRLAAINGQPSEGRTAKAWGRYALQKRGGKSCPIDIRQKINAVKCGVAIYRQRESGVRRYAAIKTYTFDVR